MCGRKHHEGGALRPLITKEAMHKYLSGLGYGGFLATLVGVVEIMMVAVAAVDMEVMADVEVITVMVAATTEGVFLPERVLGE